MMLELVPDQSYSLPANGHNLNFIGGVLRFATGANGLPVEFQSCQPNFGGYDGKNGRPIGGQLSGLITRSFTASPNPLFFSH